MLRNSQTCLRQWSLVGVELLEGDKHAVCEKCRYGVAKSCNLFSLPICGFIAQLVEHRTGIAEVTGSNPVEALIFQASSFQLLKLEINCVVTVTVTLLKATAL